ncbi:MAG: cadherin-like beta sandwich domain-containing protein [Bacillota bacterium]|nr:cadherin-like beta sandwich domain-containing protein [Bacillota bacterium]
MAEINLALNKPATASSYVKPYEPARAVNGTYGVSTPTSRWLCNQIPGWMMVDLGVNGNYSYWINRWVVRHMTVAGWLTPDYNMLDFKLQGSNDRNTWYDIDSVVGNIVGITDRTLATAVAYRYVRLYVSKGLKCNTALASAMELEVYQAPPLSSYLQSLDVGGLTLAPAFSSNTFAYTTPKVANNVTSIAVKPTAQDSRAAITVNNVPVTSGNSTNVPLNVGSNTISVKVTAADGMTNNTYTVTVERAAASTAYMASLTIKTPEGAIIPLNTAFSKDIQSYTANVGNSVTSVNVVASTSDGTTQVTVNGQTVPSGQAVTVSNLAVGANTITTSVAGSTTTYTVTLTRASSPYLTQVVVTYKSGKTTSTATVAINKTQVEYTADLPNTINSVTITPYSEDTSAPITVNGDQHLTNGQVSAAISVVPGTTRIPITVTSSVGSDSKSYGITIQ